MRAALLGLLVASSAYAGKAAPFVMPTAVAGADAVSVGKVADIAAETVPAGLGKGDVRPMTLAAVTIGEGHFGGARGKVEVGFFQRTGRRPVLRLADGGENRFFVKRNPAREGAFVAEAINAAVGGPGEKLDALAEARPLVAALKAPRKALTDKDASTRVTAAYLLLARYRAAPLVAKPKWEAVPAEESKLILLALADADWKADGRLSASGAFSWEELTEADGWTTPEVLGSYPDAAKKWLEENAGKYKMTRFARGEGGRSVEP